MDPEFDEMTIDIAYEVHGVRVRFVPGPASDVLVCGHAPPQDQARAAAMEFAGGGFSVAEGALTVLVRASSFAAPDPAPTEGAELTFQNGPRAGQVWRIGQAPKEHDDSGYELRLSIQKVS